MTRPVAFALGISVGALSMPLGLLVGQRYFDRHILDPHARKQIAEHTQE